MYVLRQNMQLFVIVIYMINTCSYLNIFYWLMYMAIPRYILYTYF